MKIKFPYGTTAENNALTLPSGLLSIDLTKKAIRLHDGVTQGGFELVGAQAWFPPPPGPTTLIAGTTAAGLYGLATPAEFITPTALRTAIGSAAFSGQTVLDNNTPWIKFAYGGKTLYVAQKPLISGVGWTTMNANGIVFGTTTVQIVGRTYKVRLLQGAEADPGSVVGHEWTALMKKVIDGTWAQYSQSAVDGSDVNASQGRRTLFQETMAADSTQCGYAWALQPNTLSGTSKAGGSSAFGWRPVLELVG